MGARDDFIQDVIDVGDGVGERAGHGGDAAAGHAFDAEAALAVVGDAAFGRFEADDAVDVGWDLVRVLVAWKLGCWVEGAAYANAAADVCSEAHHAASHRHDDTFASTAPAWTCPSDSRVHRPAEDIVDAVQAGHRLRHVCLADNHRSETEQQVHKRSVGLYWLEAKTGDSCTAVHPLVVERILDAERQAMQRTKHFSRIFQVFVQELCPLSSLRKERLRNAVCELLSVGCAVTKRICDFCSSVFLASDRFEECSHCVAFCDFGFGG